MGLGIWMGLWIWIELGVWMVGDMDVGVGGRYGCREGGYMEVGDIFEMGKGKV